MTKEIHKQCYFLYLTLSLLPNNHLYQPVHKFLMYRPLPECHSAEIGSWFSLVQRM